MKMPRKKKARQSRKHGGCGVHSMGGAYQYCVVYGPRPLSVGSMANPVIAFCVWIDDRDPLVVS